jgi:hypothetical protein
MTSRPIASVEVDVHIGRRLVRGLIGVEGQRGQHEKSSLAILGQVVAP